MTPYLTSQGKAVLAVGLLWLLGASALLLMGRPAAWPLLVGASALLVALLFAFMAAVPLGWVLDRSFLQLRVLPAEAHPQLYTGEVVAPRLELTNLSALSLRGLSLQAEVSSPLVASALAAFTLPAATSATLDVPLRAQISGRWFLHGFHVRCRDAFNLFEVSDYLPATQPLRFFPRGLTSRQPIPPAALLTLHDRVGLIELPVRGSGTSLRELREHQHGDPFRNIAWKATARLGRLMVREFEREVSLNTFILLDISTSMRGLTPLGGSKLEHASRLTVGLSHLLLRGANRCGLITFDDQVYGQLPPREGAAQRTRISQHLMGLNHIADKDFTAFDDHDVTDALVRYLLIHERLDFRQRQARDAQVDPSMASAAELYDLPLLDRWLYRQIAHLEATLDDPSLHVGVLSDTQDLSLQRRYCQLRGVELPYRAEVAYSNRERGLCDALEMVLSSSRDPHLILILSDLSGILHLDRLRSAFSLARARRHRPMIFAPLSPLYTPPPLSPTSHEGVLYALLSSMEGRERQEITRALQRVSTPVFDIGPHVDTHSLLRMMKRWR
jgi:uncharacterized protein (DUF58 family)